VRIAFVLTQSLESPSGLGRYWPLAKALAGRGHTVHIIALHHHFESLPEKSWLSNGVHVYYVAQMHVKKVGSDKTYFNPLQLIWLALLATLKLTSALFEIRPEIVHLGKPHPMNGVAGIIYKLKTGAALYIDCDDYEAASNVFGGAWQRKIVAWLEDTLPRQAAGVTVNTHFMRERLIGLGCDPARVVYVPNGVDRARFGPLGAEPVEMLQRQYSLAQKRVILYAGSLALASHRVDLLLRAFAQVVEQVDDAILMLVGGGEDRQRLLDLSAELGIAGSVIHVGRVSPEQVPLYYGLAYLSVDPVSDDGAARGRSPLKLYESLALGVPVVTADVGDRRLALGDGHHGFLVEPGSVDSLASILVDALRQPQQVETRRSNILADRDRMNLYWDQLVDDFERVYGPDLLMEVEAINK